MASADGGPAEKESKFLFGRSLNRCARELATAAARDVKEWTLSLNRNEKQTVVTDVAAQVARSQTLALAEYRGMTVEHLNALRKTAREKGVYLHVLKNTLARRAVAGTPFEVAVGEHGRPADLRFFRRRGRRGESRLRLRQDATTSWSSRPAPMPARRSTPKGVTVARLDPVARKCCCRSCSA